MLSSSLETVSKFNLQVMTVLLVNIVLAFAGCEAFADSNSSALNNKAPLVQTPANAHTAKADIVSNEPQCDEFIRNFPDSYEGFIDYYGFDEEKGESKYYSKYEDHITFFFGCPELEDNEKIKKVIAIGIHGRWDADAVAMFQDLSYKMIKVRIHDTVRQLERLPEESALSFWVFLFDGPHPSDKSNVAKLNELQELLRENKRQVRIVTKAFEKVQESRDH